MTKANLSAVQTAEAFLSAKAPTRKKLLAYAEAKAGVSKRKRWAHLVAAMQNNDEARLRYYAATGEARKDAAAALRKAAKPTSQPNGKPAAKPTKTSAKTRAKAAATKAVDPLGEEARKAIAAAKAAGFGPEQAAAFAAAFLAA